MSEGLEATRRVFLRSVTAVTVNPLSPDVSELRDALEESEIENVNPDGFTDLYKDEDHHRIDLCSRKKLL